MRDKNRASNLDWSKYRFEAKISNLTVKEIMNEILKLGELYQSSFGTSDNYEQIVQLISRFYNNNFDIADIMKRVSNGK